MAAEWQTMELEWMKVMFRMGFACLLLMVSGAALAAPECGDFLKAMTCLLYTSDAADERIV